jgi:phospholipase C
VSDFADFMRRLADGSLPQVSFVDPADADEHAPNDVQKGEAWFRRIYTTAIRSPLWPSLALFLTWDESGGFFDHVPPPTACPPSPDRAEFDRLGIRIMLMAISPWARAAHVSHVASDHTALLKFMGLLFDLPALSARDANAASLLDLFDFRAPAPDHAATSTVVRQRGLPGQTGGARLQRSRSDPLVSRRFL